MPHPATLVFIDALLYLARLVFGIALVGALIADGLAAATQFGFFGVLGCLALFPLTLVAMPFYALAELGTYIPLLLTYGGLLLAGTLFSLGLAMRAHVRG